MTEETPAVALRCERRWRDRRHVSGTVCAVAPDGAAFSDTLRLDVARERAAFAAAIVARFGPVAGTAADLERRLEELHQQVEADLATAPPPPSGCPYRIEGDAILWDKPTRDGPVATPLTNFRALITGETERDDGSGELARTFTISATVGGRERTGEVAAARFAAMAWPTELLGAVAVLEP